MDNPKPIQTKEKSPIAHREERILEFWNTKGIFKKTLTKESPKGNFVFFDGPPFATGLPHYGHVLPGTMKDVIPRYKTMQGYNVQRRWGWDCHGLPIENLIEKELGLKSKKDIETYGVEKFNEAARASVLRYEHEWKRIIPRLGRFVDMENSYKTMDTSYTESVWWSWKSLYDKDLAYESFKVMPYCPHCGTTLSNFEVNQGYKDITDISVFAKFELVDEPNTFLIAWTTTPWTLPGNVALAIKKDIEYVKIEKDGVFYIVAKGLAEKVFKENINTTQVFLGSALIGKKYKPVFSYYKDESLLPLATPAMREKMWRVYAGDFVTTEDGTGIVHIAPGFGDDDFQLSKKEGLPMIQHVKEDGTFKPEVTDFAGQSVKPKEDHQKADVEVIKYLAHAGLLFNKEKIIHSYPHCWRCDTPLLNFATSSWFVKVTALKDKLIAENNKVKWVPEEIGEGRFGKWLEGARDWAVSRTRYWGAPLPVWRSEDKTEVEVVGGVEELKKKTSRGNTFYLVRHGQAQNNVNNILSSNVKNEHHLTDLGRTQAQDAGKALKAKKVVFDVVYASDFIRTKETAEIISKAIGYDSGKIIFDNRLHEIQFGHLEGKSIADYHALFRGYESIFVQNIPDGEGMNDVRRRIGDFVYEIDSKYENKNIVVVSHETPLWMFESVSRGLTTKEIVDMRVLGKEFIKNAEILTVPFAKLPHNRNYELDFHRPYIDEVKWVSKSGKEMKRIVDVFDTWYDSGSMPYAQNHYPFSKKEVVPADFIAEGLDQTRGWFYTLLVLSSALFGRAPYKNIVVNGLVLAEDGKKMSKSLKNYPDLEPTIDTYGADALRYFLMASPAVRAQDVRFAEKGLDEVVKKHIQRLDNVYSFYEMYKDRIDATVENIVTLKNTLNILDKWIVIRLAEVRETMTAALERYEFDKASWPIADFVDDLSTWYIRRSRDRFKSDDVLDCTAALNTTRYILNEFAKLLAPFMPFLAEDLYQKTKIKSDPESVHLAAWPLLKVDVASTEAQNILVDMSAVRHTISVALEARVKAAIKVRQPLALLTIKQSFPAEYIELIKDEVNVKEVTFDSHQTESVVLNTQITPELKLEGAMRELLRAIQDKRKEMGLSPQDKAIAHIQKTSENEEIVAIFEKVILATANLTAVKYEEVGEIRVEKVTV